MPQASPLQTPPLAPRGGWTLSCSDPVQSLPSVQSSRSVISNSVTPWSAARQAPLSIPNSWKTCFKLMSIKSAMPSNHLVLCCPLLLPPSILPSIQVFAPLPFRASYRAPWAGKIWPQAPLSASLLLSTPLQSHLLPFSLSSVPPWACVLGR